MIFFFNIGSPILPVTLPKSLPIIRNCGKCSERDVVRFPDIVLDSRVLSSMLSIKKEEFLVTPLESVIYGIWYLGISVQKVYLFLLFLAWLNRFKLKYPVKTIFWFFSFKKNALRKNCWTCGVSLVDVCKPLLQCSLVYLVLILQQKLIPVLQQCKC